VPELVGVAHLVLRVGDWRRSADWYQGVLGFERRQGKGFSGFSHPGADFVLLFRPTEEEQVPSSVPTQRLEHIALHVPSIAALEKWKEELALKGVPAEIDHGQVGSSITLFDPDGLEVELFTPTTGGVLDPSVPAEEPSLR
jgi:catechol 2,3-dioxygenase-like lactoylglutathione lyase family enzyme